MQHLWRIGHSWPRQVLKELTSPHKKTKCRFGQREVKYVTHGPGTWMLQLFIMQRPDVDTCRKKKLMGFPQPSALSQNLVSHGPALQLLCYGMKKARDDAAHAHESAYAKVMEHATSQPASSFAYNWWTGGSGPWRCRAASCTLLVAVLRG